MAEPEERVMTIPLRRLKKDPTKKRASIAMRTIRNHVSNHMGVPEEDVWIDASTNEEIWKRGISKPPSKIRVRVIKFEDGIVEVSMPGE